MSRTVLGPPCPRNPSDTGRADTVLSFHPDGTIASIVTRGSTPESENALRFEEYAALPDGGSVPTVVRTRFSNELLAAGTIETVYRAELVEAIAPGQPPERLPVPPDFTVLDSIAGVSTTADGTIIGPLEHSPSGQSTAAERGTGLWAQARSRWLFWSGLALVVVAAVLWRRRSARGH